MKSNQIQLLYILHILNISEKQGREITLVKVEGKYKTRHISMSRYGTKIQYIRINNRTINHLQPENQMMIKENRIIKDHDI